MEHLSLHWREYVLAPEKTIEIPMLSPFNDSHLHSTDSVNLYADWVRQLRRGKSGVYWYGWQTDDVELPLFYIGKSVGHLYTTFVRHFSGVYSPVQGEHRPRSIVPANRHYTILAGVIQTTEQGAPILESRMISLWSNIVRLENRRVDGAYEFSNLDMHTFDISHLAQAKRYLRYLEVIYGATIKRSKLYREVLIRVEKLDFVPF